MAPTEKLGLMSIKSLIEQLRQKQAAIMRYGTPVMRAGWTDAKVEAAIKAVRKTRSRKVT